MESANKIALFFIGETGHGKSTLCNLTLGVEKFQVGNSMINAGTNICQIESGHFLGKPENGILDVGVIDEEEKNQLTQKLESLNVHWSLMQDYGTEQLEAKQNIYMRNPSKTLKNLKRNWKKKSFGERKTRKAARRQKKKHETETYKGFGSSNTPFGSRWALGVYNGWLDGTADECIIPEGWRLVSGSTMCYAHGRTPQPNPFGNAGNLHYNFTIEKIK